MMETSVLGHQRMSRQSGIFVTPRDLHMTEEHPVYESGLPCASVTLQPASVAISDAAA